MLKKITIVFFILIMTQASSMAISDPFIGEVQAFGLNFCPRGWLPTDGRLLPISQHTALFSILGTSYGGDGRNTLGLPNLGSKLALGEGHGPGLTDRSLGETGGENTHTLTIAEMPGHTHTVLIKEGRPVTTSADAAKFFAESALFRSTGTNLSMAATALSSAGSSQAHENRAPSLVVTYCIAVQGIFPSRS